MQATGLLPCPGATQYTPRVMSLDERKAVMASDGMKQFLSAVTPRIDEALQQVRPLLATALRLRIREVNARRVKEPCQGEGPQGGHDCLSSAGKEVEEGESPRGGGQRGRRAAVRDR